MKSFIKYFFIFLLILLPLSSVCVLFRDTVNFQEVSTSELKDTESEFDSAESETAKPSGDIVVFPKSTYITFGDSITYGADFTRQYSQMDYPYPTLVSNTLSLKSFNNYAISGSTIATDVDDLPSIYHQCLNASADADIVSVLGGVNDYNRSVELGTISDNSKTTFYGSLNSIVSLLLEKYPDAFIFLMTPYKEDCYHQFSCTESNSAGYNLEDYANAVKDVAELYNIPVLDMYNEGQYELEMYNPNSDGIHPSQEFIREYTAPQIAEFIRQNYRGK